MSTKYPFKEKRRVKTLAAMLEEFGTREGYDDETVNCKYHYTPSMERAIKDLEGRKIEIEWPEENRGYWSRFTISEQMLEPELGDRND